MHRTWIAVIATTAAALALVSAFVQPAKVAASSALSATPTPTLYFPPVDVVPPTPSVTPIPTTAPAVDVVPPTPSATPSPNPTPTVQPVQVVPPTPANPPPPLPVPRHLSRVQRINYHAGQMMTGVPLSSGPHIHVWLTDKFDWKRPRLVRNDCHPQKLDGTLLPDPAVGWWFFLPTKVKTLDCQKRPLVGAYGISLRDYNIQTRREINYTCNGIRRVARKQHGKHRKPVWVPCGYRFWRTYDGWGTRIVLTRPCRYSQSGSRIRLLGFDDQNHIFRRWCSGLRSP